jgi:hypothetical protein
MNPRIVAVLASLFWVAQGALAHAQGIDAHLIAGNRFEGVIDTPQDVDLLRFHGLAESRVSVVAKTKGTAPWELSIEIVDVKTQQQVAIASGAKTVSLKKVMLPATSLFEVRVRSVVGAGKYRLTFGQELTKQQVASESIATVESLAGSTSEIAAHPDLKLEIRAAAKGGSKALPSGPALLSGFGPLDLSTSVKSSKNGFSIKNPPVPAPGSFSLSFVNVGAAGDVKLDVGRKLKTSSKKIVEDDFEGDLDAPIVYPTPSPTKERNVTLHGLSIEPGSTIRAQTPTAVAESTAGSDHGFSVDVPLAVNAKNVIYVTEQFEGGGASGATVLVVVCDQQPPQVIVDVPAEGEVVHSGAVDVAGRVSDMLSGFLGLHVLVNDQPAVVDVGQGTNGTFLATGVPLKLGVNTIQVSASDLLGNVVSQELTIDYAGDFVTGLRLSPYGGNAQTGLVHAWLPAPVAVTVLDHDGAPLPDRVVTFEVTASDGLLGEAADTQGATQVVQVRSDEAGVARAFWRLGGDAGCGNQRVRATIGGSEDSVGFCASAAPAIASQINVGSGNNQACALGGAPLLPLEAWVSDACNGIAAMPVTFKVVEGAGLVDGAKTATVMTDQTGHAAVHFTAGGVAGRSAVTATFPGNPGAPAVFAVQALDPTNGVTEITGLVLDNADQPIAGVSIALLAPGFAGAPAVSGADGRFLLSGLPPGPARVHVDGSTATAVGGVPPVGGSFPGLEIDVLVVEDALNELPMAVRLPFLANVNQRFYSTVTDTDLTIEGVEGLSMTITAGSMTIDGAPAPNGTVVSLNQVHHDNVPMPMPDGAAPPFAWTFQPAGAHFDPPVSICYPNMSGLAPGTATFFLTFNHHTGAFEIESSGHVTADGSCIMSDPGGGLTTAGWGCNCPPYAVTGDCETCCDDPMAATLGGMQICEGKACCVDEPVTALRDKQFKFDVGPYQYEWLGIDIPKLTLSGELHRGYQDLCCEGFEGGTAAGCAAAVSGTLSGSTSKGGQISLGGPLVKAIKKFVCDKLDAATGGTVDCDVGGTIGFQGASGTMNVKGGSNSCTGVNGWAGSGQIGLQGVAGKLNAAVKLLSLQASFELSITDTVNGIITLKGMDAAVLVSNGGPTIAGELKILGFTVNFDHQFTSLAGSKTFQISNVNLPPFPACQQ